MVTQAAAETREGSAAHDPSSAGGSVLSICSPFRCHSNCATVAEDTSHPRAPALCSVGTAGPTVAPADTLGHLRTPKHTATLLRPQEPAPSLRKYCPTGNEHISWTESQQVRQETNREEGPTSHRQPPGRGGCRRHSSQVRHVPPTLQPRPPPSSLAVGGGPCLGAWGEGELAALVAGFH